MDDERKKGPRGPGRGGKAGAGQKAGGGGKPRRPSDDKPRRSSDGQPRRPFDGKSPFARASGSGPAKRPDASPSKEEGGQERIARRLARAGLASRRDAEAMIAAGRVALNGKVLDSPAVNVGPGDRIEVDGAPIPEIERTRLFLFHKPAGIVTTNRDPEGRRTVFDLLPKELPRLMTVGRLDINTEGLLLFTNDGGLARSLELPATGWLRRYRVRVHGSVDEKALAGLAEGVAVDGVFYGAVEAALDRVQGSNAWLSVGLREGKNREVKNILASLGLDVNRLIRVSYGPFQLGELAEGEIRELRGRYLRDQLGERLIADSGANFDAPVLREFSNSPAAAKPAAAPAREARSAPPPNRKRERERKREDALGRLQTKLRERGGQGDKRDKPAEKPRSRASNVWMAPGAKPMGEKKLAEHAERTENRRYAGKPRPRATDPNKRGGPKGRPGGSGGTGRPAGRHGKPRGKG